uniref:Radical_SAM domain-containing protein n=1 Tax=Echinostoma caproni TaxID=27848 RepID=A0A183BGR9_9TREM
LGGAALDLPKIRRNPLIEILAVSTGCLNACTYCKTKHARGVLASYPIDQLLARANQAFAEGVKELWLTSEDLGAYGRDLDRRTAALSCPSMDDRFPHCLTLADLLAGLVRLIPPGCMLRLGMTNPPYILEQLDEIAEVLSHPRVYAFLHIPVQSGKCSVFTQSYACIEIQLTLVSASKPHPCELCGFEIPNYRSIFLHNSEYSKRGGGKLHDPKMYCKWEGEGNIQTRTSLLILRLKTGMFYVEWKIKTGRVFHSCVVLGEKRWLKVRNATLGDSHLKWVTNCLCSGSTRNNERERDRSGKFVRAKFKVVSIE